jgi:hypothetical protein
MNQASLTSDRHSSFHHDIRNFLLQTVGVGNPRFQLIAQRHQIVDFGDDAVLFGDPPTSPTPTRSATQTASPPPLSPATAYLS